MKGTVVNLRMVVEFKGVARGRKSHGKGRVRRRNEERGKKEEEKWFRGQETIVLAMACRWRRLLKLPAECSCNTTMVVVQSTAYWSLELFEVLQIFLLGAIFN